MILIGILGLSFPTLSNLKYVPLFDNIMRKKQLKKNWFSFYLTDQNEDGKSQVVLGEPSKEFYEGDIHWHQVTEESYWQVEMEDIYVGGKAINMCPGGCKLVIDTGTSIITGPSDDLDSLLNRLPLNDCDDISSLPEIGFRIGHFLYTMKPQEYILFANKKSTSMLEIASQEMKLGVELEEKLMKSHTISETNFKSKNHSCKRAFMPLDVQAPKGPLWVLGDIFLRKYFVIFDRDSKRIGISVRRKNVKET